MTEQYQLPSATVLSVVAYDDTVRITIAISREDYLRYPIAPADLRRPDTQELVFPFHQLIRRDGMRLEFETYDADLPIPDTGKEFAFCSWWVPDAMDAVRDVSAEWRRRPYPDNGEHDQCLFTYETMAAYSDHKEGYHSSHGWITIEAHTKYIERDCLRIRSRSRS